MKDRVILHCDCNSFFASVETALCPEYRNVPMAVCGSEELRHGIVLAKNELAKAYGIQTAETVFSARKKCPSLVIAKPHYDAYSAFSKKVNEIYSNYTDKIEQFGIDESWLDVTDSQRLFGNGLQIAETIRKRVKDEIGITISIGVSFNKVFAKLGSDYKKPDAITLISRENYTDIVYPLPACDLLFVGKKTGLALERIGVYTIGDLAALSSEYLISKFGKLGLMLHKYSRGLDDSEVEPQDTGDVKSVGNGYTFKRDLVSLEDVRVGVYYLAEEIARRLRHKGKRAQTIAVTIKDAELHSIQRQSQMRHSTDIGDEIAKASLEIFDREWCEGQPIRMITLTASGLVSRDGEYTQMGMFDEEGDELRRKKDKEREKTVDLIKSKYGTSAITRGSLIHNDIGLCDK